MEKKISDLITTNEIETWNQGEIITINASTGAGKSYFVMNTLYEHAKKNNQKILILCNRKLLKKQFINDIIDVKTYQSLESKTLNKKSLDFLSDYTYIVADEFHYFLTDSSFNSVSDISLSILLNLNSKVRIFMSATSDLIVDYIENIKELKTKSYSLPKSFDFIDTLYFYEDDKVLKKMIIELPLNEKAIYFSRSAEKAYEVSRDFQDISLFNCSTYNKSYAKHMDLEKINEMLINEKFESQILCTTHSMDNGVNIKDEQVKHIIIDILDFEVFLQCLGRKRIMIDSEKINLYVRNVGNNEIGGKVVS